MADAGAVGTGAAASAGDTLFAVAQPFLSILGGGRFPVRRIYCIGRNYADHAREMGGDPQREPPFFFQKPSDSVQSVSADTVAEHPYPPLTEDYHHELELVVCLKGGGRDVTMSDALALVYGYAVGLDMTRRDLQQRAKDTRRPWSASKGFDQSAPVGLVAPASRVGHPATGAITLRVNDALRQDGDLADMVWSVPELIAELSRFSELKAGDIVMTGTPAGVGPGRARRRTGRLDRLFAGTSSSGSSEAVPPPSCRRRREVPSVRLDSE